MTFTIAPTNFAMSNLPLDDNLRNYSKYSGVITGQSEDDNEITLFMKDYESGLGAFANIEKIFANHLYRLFESKEGSDLVGREVIMYGQKHFGGRFVGFGPKEIQNSQEIFNSFLSLD